MPWRDAYTCGALAVWCNQRTRIRANEVPEQDDSETVETLCFQACSVALKQLTIEARKLSDSALSKGSKQLGVEHGKELRI